MKNDQFILIFLGVNHKL